MTVQPAAPPASTERVKELLVEGNTLTEVAAATRWPESRVRALVNAIHGWLIDPATNTVYQPGNRHMKPNLPDVDAAPSNQVDGPVTPRQPAPNPSRPGSVDELLARAADLDDKTIQREHTKTLQAIEKLRAAVDEHGERAEKTRVLRATITELEKQLADAKAEAKELGIRVTAPRHPDSAPATTAAADPDKAERDAMRAWAAEHGVSCPDRGRIPEAVRTAYEQRNGASQ